MATKLIFETDPHNRLTVRTASDSRVARYRRTLEGTFRQGKGNSLVYQIRKSSGAGTPQQIKFSGNWKLDTGNTLAFTLDKWNHGHEGKLVIDGSVIDARADELAFQVHTKGMSGFRRFYVLKLKGGWQADQYNRLCFNVEKERSTCDRITFQGEWSVNKANQLVYSFTKRSLKRKEVTSQSIVFKGYWEVSAKYRISYILSKEAGSRFDFQAGAAEAKDGYLRYEIAVGAAPGKKRLTLSGAWRLDDRKGIIFEMKREGGRVTRMVFGGRCRLGKGKVVEAKLTDAQRRDVGISLKLSQAFAGGKGERYLEIMGSKKECSFSAGAGLLW